MNIDRHNYEEWFLLYADDELSAAERREVEAFMERNPDLAGELDIFRQLKLDPSEVLNFSGKASLYREEEVSEEDSLLISFLDGELHGASRTDLERRLATDPALAARLEQYRATVLPAEAISFPDKSTLYRRSERTTPIISMRFVRVAVAAAVIIAGGLLWFSQQSAVSPQQTGSGQQIAGNVQRPEGGQQSAVSGQQTESNQQLAGSEQPAIQNPESGIQNRVVTIAPQERNNDGSSNDVALNNDNGQTKIQQPTTNNQQPASNNLPTPENQQPTTDIAVNVPAPSTVGSTTEIVDRPSINTVAKSDYATQALLNPGQQDEPVLDDGNKARKGPFRGLVRKANRLFNKATNPDPDKATVKVASFEFALGR